MSSIYNNYANNTPLRVSAYGSGASSSSSSSESSTTSGAAHIDPPTKASEYKALDWFNVLGQNASNFANAINIFKSGGTVNAGTFDSGGWTPSGGDNGGNKKVLLYLGVAVVVIVGIVLYKKMK